MEKEELGKLYQERSLIKQLIRLDKARYNHLEVRSHEIKTKINSEYGIYDPQPPDTRKVIGSIPILTIIKYRWSPKTAMLKKMRSPRESKGIGIISSRGVMVAQQILILLV